MVLYKKENVTILNSQFSFSKVFTKTNGKKTFKSIFHIYEFYLLKYLYIARLF